MCTRDTRLLKQEQGRGSGETVKAAVPTFKFMHRSMNLLAFVKKKKSQVDTSLPHKSHIYCVYRSTIREKKRRGDLTHIQWKLNHLFHSTSRQTFGLKREARQENSSEGDRARSVGCVWVSRWASGGTCWRRGSATHCDTVAAQHLHEDVWRWRSGADARFSLLNLSGGSEPKNEQMKKCTSLSYR